MTRRIRSLRIHAPTDAMARRGTTLVEDALRTASIPSATHGRRLVIRRLSLGGINTQRSPNTIALQIEHRVREISTAAVHGYHPSAPMSEAVYFNDEVEPYLCLAQRIAKSQPLEGWYWPLVIPGWQSIVAEPRTGWRQLLFQVIQTQPGILASAVLAADLHDHNLIGVMLDALQYEDGPLLLQAYGLDRTDTSHADHGKDPPPTTVTADLATWDRLSPSWQSILTHYMDAWDPTDARSVWLAAIVLLIQNKTRVVVPKWSVRASELIAASQIRIEQRADPTRSFSSSSMDEERDRIQQHHLDRHESPIDQQNQRPGVHSLDPSLESNWDNWDDVPDDRLPTPFPPESAGEDHHERDDGRSSKLDRPFRATETKSDASAHTHDLNSRTALNEPTAGPLTEIAGLFYLVSIFNCLGMEEMLTEDPTLIEWELPRRLLKHFSQRMRLESHDPALEVFEVQNLDPSIPSPATFVSPTAWDSMIVSETLNLGRAADKSHLLWDNSGYLPLAQWRGRPSQAIRTLMDRHPNIGRHGLIWTFAKDSVICEAWRRAVKRWCRRFVGLGLRSLVCRPGRIAFTNTHLDVYLNLNQLDVRIRQAGIDLDPGWVPWLGRVVHYHYVGEIDHDR